MGTMYWDANQLGAVGCSSLAVMSLMSIEGQRSIFIYWYVSAVISQCLCSFLLLTLMQHINGKLLVVAMYRCSSFGDWDLYFWEIRIKTLAPDSHSMPAINSRSRSIGFLMSLLLASCGHPFMADECIH